MKQIYWKRIRQASQLVCLFVFLALFRLTDYNGSDEIDWAVNIFFRMDPLVGLSVTLATREMIALLWPCLVIAGLTLVLGRFFCGWICPLGTLIDGAGKLAAPSRQPDQGRRFRYIKYMLLCLVLVSSLFSVQLLGFFDPFALLVRGLVFSLDPLFNLGITSVFDQIYLSGPEWISAMTEPVYDLLKTWVLPYQQSFFRLGLVSFLILAGIFCLELAGRRFWCRNICPLGALLGLCAKSAVLRRVPRKSCRHCGLCQSKCAMAPFDAQDRFMDEECHLCMDCLAYCPDAIAGFSLGLPARIKEAIVFKTGGVKNQAPNKQAAKKQNRPAGPDIGRRRLMASAALGVCFPLLTKVGTASAYDRLIRPPGAMDEADFLATCVRCGECMKVCITQGLQPLGLETGLAAMFTPVLVPRIGHCEFNCRLCASVCPTRAIRPLAKREKQAHVMGRAWFDKNRCLPWAEKKECLVCEEHCPVHNKAIQFETIELTGMDLAGKDLAGRDAAYSNGRKPVLKQPYVVADRCIGCGICENVCPVPGPAAIRVLGRDTRPEKKRGGTGGYG